MSLDGTCPQCKGDLQVMDDGWVVILMVPAPLASKIVVDSIHLVVVQGEGAEEQPVTFELVSDSIVTGNKRKLEWSASPTYVPSSARLRFVYQPIGDATEGEEEDVELVIEP